MVQSANADYIKGLTGLQRCLERVEQATPDKKEDSKTACQQTELATAQTAADSLAGTFAVDTQGKIDKTVTYLLKQPLSFAGGILKPQPPPGPGPALCTALRDLATKFPFNSSAKEDATLPDIQRVFQPADGLFSKYNKSPDGTVKFDKPAAADLQRALYAADPQKPQVQFTLTVRGTRGFPSGINPDISITMGGQTLHYSGQPASTSFIWTVGSGQQLTVLIGGAPFTSYPVAWSPFRFFKETLNWRQASGGARMDYSMRSGAQEKYLELELSGVKGTPEIFKNDHFTGLRCR